MTLLRVAHLNDALSWRGGERQSLELMKGLRDRGAEPLLICRAGSEIGRRARSCGIETAVLPLLGEWDLFSALRIRRLIIRRNAAILHTHTAHAHALGLMALTGNRDCRLVVSRRVDFHLRGGIGRSWKYGRGVDRFIAVSDAIRNVLIEDGVDPARVVTVRSGFIPDEFRDGGGENLRERLGIPADAVVVVTVAALAPHKAHGVLLRAAARVARKHPGVRFLLAGEGETRPEIERDIRELGLEGVVILLGFVRDIGAVYRAADVFAISSSEEGLCSSLLDAMHFRLPVVATRAGGIPELISDGVNGFVVPVGDHVSLAERLCLLVEQDALRREMGAASVPVLERNAISRTVEQTLDVYRELVSVRSVAQACPLGIPGQEGMS